MKTIFIVDDNDTNRAAAKNALDGTYKTFALSSAARMFQLAERFSPHLILLDIDMPEMDGFEAMERIKQDENLQNCPVIFLTASQNSETEIRGFELGAIDYIIKPFSKPLLIRRIETHLFAEEQKQKLKSMFKKYVDPKLAERLIRSGEAETNEVGAFRDIAVLFSDVRGFTSIAEKLRDNPGVTVNILNEYLELTSTSIFNNGGNVDKFIGDATMALFNGFVHLDDYVYKAVKAALEMVAGADQVNRSIKNKYGIDTGFGVGINCGGAIVGNVGPSFRKDYTAIGDTVNVAARLSTNAESSQILISQNVYETVKERVRADFVGEMALKGKSYALNVYSVKELN